MANSGPIRRIDSAGSGEVLIDPLGTFTVQTPSDNPLVVTGNFTNNGGLKVEDASAMTLMNVSSPSASVNLGGVLILGGDLTLEGTISSPTGFSEVAGGGTLKIGNGMSATTLTLGDTTLMNGNVEVTAGSTLTGAALLINSGNLTLDLGSTTAGLGSYQQSLYGTLSLQATANGNSSALSVTGEAQLSGILSIDFVGGYTPKSGDQFAVLTAGSIAAHFDTTPPDMTVSYGSGSVTLTQN